MDASVDVHNHQNIRPIIKNFDQILVVVEIHHRLSTAVFTPKAFSCGQVVFPLLTSEVFFLF